MDFGSTSIFNRKVGVVLMSFVDIVILVIVAMIVVFLSYHLFFKKERSHCSGCAEMTKAKRRNKGLKKLFK